MGELDQFVSDLYVEGLEKRAFSPTNAIGDAAVGSLIGTLSGQATGALLGKYPGQSRDYGARGGAIGGALSSAIGGRSDMKLIVQARDLIRAAATPGAGKAQALGSALGRTATAYAPEIIGGATGAALFARKKHDSTKQASTKIAAYEHVLRPFFPELEDMTQQEKIAAIDGVLQAMGIQKEARLTAVARNLSARGGSFRGGVLGAVGGLLGQTTRGKALRAQLRGTQSATRGFRPTQAMPSVASTRPIHAPGQVVARSGTAAMPTQSAVAARQAAIQPGLASGATPVAQRPVAPPATTSPASGRVAPFEVLSDADLSRANQLGYKIGPGGIARPATMHREAMSSANKSVAQKRQSRSNQATVASRPAKPAPARASTVADVATATAGGAAPAGSGATPVTPSRPAAQPAATPTAASTAATPAPVAPAAASATEATMQKKPWLTNRRLAIGALGATGLAGLGVGSYGAMKGIDAAHHMATQPLDTPWNTPAYYGAQRVF